ncbi:MAG TPA: ACT domain-containing protein [Clostridiales bacterium]|jgi:hypothetical protein|nr:ACT domain-containing protein [Clostridiales bacterium]
MYLFDQISVFVVNRPGRISRITAILTEHNVDIRALSMVDTTDFSILRLIVDKPTEAEAALKAKGLTVKKTAVIAPKLDDEPGSLHRMMERLRDSQIVVEYTYAMIPCRCDDACIILRVENPQAAANILMAHGFKLMTQEELPTRE